MPTIPIHFTPEQLATLDAAIMELPYKQAAPLVAHINAEIQRHQEAQRAAAVLPEVQP